VTGDSEGVWWHKHGHMPHRFASDTRTVITSEGARSSLRASVEYGTGERAKREGRGKEETTSSDEFASH